MQPLLPNHQILNSLCDLYYNTERAEPWVCKKADEIPLQFKLAIFH